jgi:hypothetical protein
VAQHVHRATHLGVDERDHVVGDAVDRVVVHGAELLGATVPTMVDGQDLAVWRERLDVEREVVSGAGEAVTEHERHAGRRAPTIPVERDTVDGEPAGEVVDHLADPTRRCSFRAPCRPRWRT